MVQFTVKLHDHEDETEQSKWLLPFAATASQHYYGQTILWRLNPDPERIDIVDQDFVEPFANDAYRPVIYIAENAHATYFRNGNIDSDILSGCPTQEQYDSTPNGGYDRILPGGNVHETYKLLALQGSPIFNWADARNNPGRWGQAYDRIVKVFAGPPSPAFRAIGLGSNDPDTGVVMVEDPAFFHQSCAKTALEEQLRFR